MIINFSNLGSGGGSGTGSVVSWEQEVTAGTQIASITINGTSQNVYAPEGGDEDAQEVISTALNDLNERNGELLKELDTLPENPVDGAVYNYQGRLIKYVNGPGNWGEWSNLNTATGYGRPNVGGTSLSYGVIPSSMEGELAFGFGYIKSSSADTNVALWAFFNLQDNTIDVYDNKDKTGSTLYNISLNAGVETVINRNSINVNVSWNNNIIQIRPNTTYSQVLRWCNTAINNSHYELAESVPFSYPVINSNVDPITFNSNESGWLVLSDNNNGTVRPWTKLTKNNIYINTSGSSNALSFYSNASTPINRMFVPTASGETGTILVSAGNTAPVWQSLSTALGIQHIWTGTQDAYDALGTYDNSTLYFIVEEE